MSGMNALSKKEQKKLLNWYDENGYARFHYMNAATCSILSGCVTLYSYYTPIARLYHFHKWMPAYNAFSLVFLDENATHYSGTTTRHLTRFLSENLNASVCVAEVRDLQRCGIWSFVDYTRHACGMNVIDWIERHIINPHIEEPPASILAYGGTFDDYKKVKAALCDMNWYW